MFKRKNGKSKKPKQKDQPVLTASVAVAPSDGNDEFSARPSNRAAAASNQVQADGDTWQEALAVCEMPSRGAGPNARGALTVRSYFENTRSGARVWDEPPSGASNILPASEEMRRMANAQLEELQVVSAASGEELTPGGSPSRRKFGLFRNNNASRRGLTGQSDPDRRIRYRPDGQVAGTAVHEYTGSVNDQNLQQAIALSLADNAGLGEDSHKSPTLAWQIKEVSKLTPEEQEQLAMAMSLSMADEIPPDGREVLAAAAESPNSPSAPKVDLSEEEMLSLALAESRIDAERAGYNTEDGNKLNREGDLLGLSPPPVAQRKRSPGQSIKPPPNHSFAPLENKGEAFDAFDLPLTAAPTSHQLVTVPPTQSYSGAMAQPPESSYHYHQRQTQMEPAVAPKKPPPPASQEQYVPGPMHSTQGTQQMQPYYAAPKKPPSTYEQEDYHHSSYGAAPKKPPPSQEQYPPSQMRSQPYASAGPKNPPPQKYHQQQYSNGYQQQIPKYMLKAPPPSSAPAPTDQPYVASSQYSRAMMKDPPRESSSPTSLRKMEISRGGGGRRGGGGGGGHKKPSTANDAAGLV